MEGNNLILKSTIGHKKMTKQQAKQAEQEIFEQVTANEEMEYYKNQANRLGLKYPENVELEALAKMVKAKIEEGNDKVIGKESGLTSKSAKVAEEALKLCRFRLHVLNPAKQNWTGEYITAGNDYIPHVTRFIPFHAPIDGWHCEEIILSVLRYRKYQLMQVDPSQMGVKAHVVNVNKNKLLPEFAIEILEQLTPEQIAELAARQDAQGSIDKE